MGFSYSDYTPGLRLVVHAGGSPTDEAWEAMVESVRHISAERFRTLVLSDGAMPTSQQFKRLDSVLTGLDVHPKTAVVSNSTAMRAIVSAAAWMSKNQHKAFKPAELQEAFRFLSISGSEASRMQLGIDAACRKFGIPVFDEVTKRAG